MTSTADRPVSRALAMSRWATTTRLVSCRQRINRTVLAAGATGTTTLDRLTSANRTSLSQGWTYDLNGNRLTETGTAASTYTVSATSNRLDSVTGAVTRSSTYLASGQLSGDGARTFGYDDAEDSRR